MSCIETSPSKKEYFNIEICAGFKWFWPRTFLPESFSFLQIFNTAHCFIYIWWKMISVVSIRFRFNFFALKDPCWLAHRLITWQCPCKITWFWIQYMNRHTWCSCRNARSCWNGFWRQVGFPAAWFFGRWVFWHHLKLKFLLKSLVLKTLWFHIFVTWRSLTISVRLSIWRLIVSMPATFFVSFLQTFGVELGLFINSRSESKLSQWSNF